MNKLNEMHIAELKSSEVAELQKFEKSLNHMHQGEELYVLVLRQ
ncbi:hypothetical protein [Thermincola ferriacetica]